MKIGVVIDGRMWKHSGIGVYISNLISRIEKRNIMLLIDSRSRKQPGLGPTRPFNSPIYSVKEQFLFPFVIPATTLFWSPHYNVPLFPIRASKRVVTIHDVYHLAHYNELPFLQKIYSKLLMTAAVRLSDRIITVSAFSKREILKYCRCDPSKITVIPNGVKQKISTNDLATIRSKYNLPENFFLFVGNVKPHKNISKVLEALLLLDPAIQKNFNVVVVGKKDGFITGDPALLEWIATNPQLKEKLIFTGYVSNDDLDSVYQLASLFIFPSLYEGFGLPPLEAMLNGCPVLASTAASIPEVCGDAALYFEPTDACDLRDKMNMVLNNPILRAELIVKGKARVKEFTWEQCAEAHSSLFTSLIGANK